VTPALLSLLIDLHNLIAERVHRSPTLRLIIGPAVLACLRRIEKESTNAPA
jgi:hypothetical protein